jgi:hypothetical protein
MSTEIWLAIMSVLFAVIGTLAGLGYRDVASRLKRLERQDSKLNAAILTLLVAKSDDSHAIAHALHGLLANGIDTTGH